MEAPCPLLCPVYQFSGIKVDVQHTRRLGYDRAQFNQSNNYQVGGMINMIWRRFSTYSVCVRWQIQWWELF